MENIKYINEDIANSRKDLLVFDLNTSRSADFLAAFAEVLHSRCINTTTDSDVIAREIVGNTCSYEDELCYNFNAKYNSDIKKFEFNSIYRDYDGKLVVYTPNSANYGIQCNKTNEECIKFIAKMVKQLSYCKFVYDRIIEFTNKALTEIDAAVEDMRSRNNGELVSNYCYDYTVFTKKLTFVSDYCCDYTVFNKRLTLKNAILDFIVGYEHRNATSKYRDPIQYFQLNVNYTSGNRNQENVFTIKYNPDKKRYSGYLSEFLNTLELDDEFNNEWNSENTKPSVFSGFTIGETKDIYDLLIDKNTAIRNMSTDVKNKYINSGIGLSPVELEVYKQLKNELSENVNKAINDLNNTYKNLRQMIKDTKNKANEEMSSKYNEAIENFKNNVNKYNDILAENGCGLSLSDEIPNELLSHKYKNFS